MSPLSDASLMSGMRFPRVSGDEPEFLTRSSVTSKFSPRERG